MVRPLSQSLSADDRASAGVLWAGGSRMTLHHYDVCVVGGGPAGAIAGFRVALLGHSVLIIQRPDRQKVGAIESLSTGSCRLLSELGLGDSIKADGVVWPAQATICWSKPRSERNPEGAMIVERKRFDGM